MGIGQAAGTLAAIAILNDSNLQSVDVRKVQQHLLDFNGYLMPYIDIQPNNKHFQAIQRIGAAGVLKGFGVPYKWANQTWFYPDKEISQFELVDGLRPLYPVLSNYWNASGESLKLPFLLELMQNINPEINIDLIKHAWEQGDLGVFKKDNDNPLTRKEVAVLVDRLLNPFSIPIDLQGLLRD